VEVEMSEGEVQHVFLSYGQASQDFVEALARRLQGDARLSFWFGPWHSIPGVDRQEQMQEALRRASSCAVCLAAGGVEGWQNEQLRAAIQTRVEDDARYRVIPVLLSGASRPRKQDLPLFLCLYEMVEFSSPEDEMAFRRLLAGILGIPPIQVEGFLHAQTDKEKLPPPPSGAFERGHALIIGVAGYPRVRPLPEVVLDDARALGATLVDPARCGYSEQNVAQLLDSQATGQAIRDGLNQLAQRAGPDDTAIVFFSGHGAHNLAGDGGQQYILPYDCDADDLAGSAISGDEMTNMLRSIQASRLLVLFDSCHSGGAGDPKGILPQFKSGLAEDFYQALAQGKGRVVMASSRPDEVSWALANMPNSLFTHYLLEALRGQARTLGDGYVRVFDVFRHVADNVPRHASQHPIFKATAMEDDFPIALIGKR
jgi:hypothetical protein